MLRALARCLLARAAAAGAAGGSAARSPPPRGDELADLQDAVRLLASELHSKRTVLSFAMLADITVSLEAVLPLTGWPLRDPRLLTDLLAQLPRAAATAAAAAAPPNASATASAHAPPPAPLGELCRAFGSAHALALRCAEAGGAGRASAEVPALLERLRQFLASEVLGDGRAAMERLRGADLASMAAAVRLANKYGAPVSQPFMDLLTARVSSVLSAAATDDGSVGGGRELQDVGGQTGGRGEGRKLETKERESGLRVSMR
ncbi:hypothetical protein GPECTOR_30g265 [Gonium pectorale]|uniref:Uncharacterized protein n=1 Tax=Gonium pectorale TaxID=33097 RepID=A0A150GEA5_GONPE|nr:hypothetical protein GPECTOR_30g265 [Gonium pectorale]|eukprot:KXZ48169.1 hypothetical protein GPECTOR_30g265 [Gonium pectorale]